NVPGPLVLRVNQRRTTMHDVINAFDQAGIDARALNGYAVWLPEPRPVQALPGFQQGWWSVQDLSAQRAGALLPLESGMRVLDACAAPGGKTAHLLEQANLRLLALDADASRPQRVQGTLDLLGLSGSTADISVAAPAHPIPWWAIGHLD